MIPKIQPMTYPTKISQLTKTESCFNSFQHRLHSALYIITQDFRGGHDTFLVDKYK